MVRTPRLKPLEKEHDIPNRRSGYGNLVKFPFKKKGLDTQNTTQKNKVPKELFLIP